MTRNRAPGSGGTPGSCCAVIVVLLALTASSGAEAQPGGARRLHLASPAAFTATEAVWPPGQQSPSLPTGPRARPVKRKVLFGVIGAVAGGFIGGAVGAAIEGNSCACDDPGLQGWMIGAPIGSTLGALVAVKLAR